MPSPGINPQPLGAQEAVSTKEATQPEKERVLVYKLSFSNTNLKGHIENTNYQ